MPSSSMQASSRRSRSPAAESIRSGNPRRTRSPHALNHHHHQSSSHKRPRHDRPPPITLPGNAPNISKHDFKIYRSIFALYLEVQKQLDVNDLSSDEVRGRWKSFVGKWNRGELASGWYGPQMFAKAEQFVAEAEPPASVTPREPLPPDRRGMQEDESSDDDMPGPSLPGVAGRRTRAGPAIPSVQDLELQRELAEEDSFANRAHLRNLRTLDRKAQRERLEELVPRAETGSKDRMLEKKREKADSNRAFAAGKTEAGGVDDVPEGDLLGGDEDGIEGFKKEKKEVERKKNEREVRRDEVLRARQAEREERIREYQEKEARTMSGLVALARARFGDGGAA